jgi:tRNA threonylcarbamoyladenosine biosynthesis protein TsaE
MEYISHSAAETFELGRKIGQDLPINTVIGFFGDLAAGKTTFIKGLVQGAAGLDPSIVQSPTFTYLNIYNGTKTLYHFDLYRLRDVDEFMSMGFDEYFDAGGICCIEWSERIADRLPPSCMKIRMEHQGADVRRILVIKGK